MRYLTLAEVLHLHTRVGAATGGAGGLRDLAALESVLAQPRQAFGGADLYPDLPAKAAVLAFGLIRGHPFVDDDKRIGHAAMEVSLLLNGLELQADIADAERMIVAVAATRPTDGVGGVGTRPCGPTPSACGAPPHSQLLSTSGIRHPCGAHGEHVSPASVPAPATADAGDGTSR